ncbi:MAG: histidine kinase [Candidatus Muproteobacteria bacterium RIFCSPHIGHO2_12_FULL_60_33]|uniref:Histidine kinase n=1 Tax=Candidatus Muproteobacteria bacterium RIFCSPLOWO2_01_FULL_60_18 TaxID=1817768 RepID=A0A1F6TY32_9PROT|nr:MAG: histidine kinase [Candidatus Muproteobacteria bacterium RIFCSPLOWO2_01_FULL_60_18]OGI53532.1 MAG: histidine kinase [Candidatus Muproteobacteria bacterium RIFCSPHIGHO2_01_60_12]OGI53832.1 MAG: histidine kinase [Candidatus Muproteobacteria bacterium RIFCSPHIGHO2_02_FULL_60_13]OGI54619.1 MAG: histidine kinase [Candidatus Muproteobacteria bacterium RIFCSPHIGHO2_12_FULL_60_33]OGI58916.1 MAG: histidine kinase [Candidatus Muproteobacteria bacterium RIFCSPHIGHO2_01_FULL_61_200]
MLVGKICNREVVFVHQDTSIPEAARLMREHHVGDLVVVKERNGKRVPVGIVTDRDIVLEVIAEGVDMNDVNVGDIMSDNLVTAREGDDLLETIKVMRAKGIRRLPVIDDDNELAGILSVDDLLELFSEQIADLARLIAFEQKREKESRK